jgi:hypothetical protein
VLLNSPAEAVPDAARCEDPAANCLGRCVNPSGGTGQNKCLSYCDRQEMFDTRAWRGRAVVGGDGIEPPTANASVSAAHQCARGRARCPLFGRYCLLDAILLHYHSVSVPIGAALLARFRRAVLFGVARERFGGTLADHEGSLLSAMMPISFRGANDDFQGG